MSTLQHRSLTGMSVKWILYHTFVVLPRSTPFELLRVVVLKVDSNVYDAGITVGDILLVSI